MGAQNEPGKCQAGEELLCGFDLTGRFSVSLWLQVTGINLLVLQNEFDQPDTHIPGCSMLVCCSLTLSFDV